MALYPFYFAAKQDQNPLVDLTEYEEQKRKEDYESINAQKEYHRTFHNDWKKGGALYNVIQEGSTDDRISNFYIGLSRMVIDTGIGMMTEGEPEFDFDPLGPADQKKVILWKALVKKILSDCNYKAHQEKWVTDMHVFGPAALEVYTQLPMRLRRHEHEDGRIEEKLVRDFRRTKVGIRHRSIWHTYRNANIIDPDDVPTGGFTEDITRSQFVQNYMNVKLPNGKPKYKNLDKVPVASHYRIEHCYDELQDAYRIYALPYGTTPEGAFEEAPENELGMPIFDKPLCIYRTKKTIDGKEVTISNGANVPGMVPLCFGNFNDQLDADFKTHAVYGMGIPQLIDGPEAVMQAMFNMTVDNMRLKNTVVIGYEGSDGKSAMDLDNLMYYSGQFVDGKINPQSMGIADITSNQVMWEWLNNICIWVTGINFQQLGGDTSKTAFEFAQRIRANNQRAEKRIRSLENGPLKRAGMLLLSNALSEMTVEEWDDLSEGQVEEIAAKIESNDATAEDYQFEGGKPVRKRMMMDIPVEGHKFREDFKGKNKKRSLDYNSTDNTLIEDKDLPGEVSFVPAHEKYLLPSGDIESILRFGVRVDGKSMLGDQKAQDIQMYDKLLTGGVNLVTAGLAPNLDLEKIYLQEADFMGIDRRKITKDQDDASPLITEGQKAVEELQATLTQPSNVQPVQAGMPAASAPVPSPQAPVPAGPPAPSSQAGGPPAALAATASGTL